MVALGVLLCIFPTEAVAARGRKKPTAAQVEKARTVLAGDSFKLRVKALEVLAASDDPRAYDDLVAVLKDRDGTMRASACDALAIHGDVRAIGPMEALASDVSPFVVDRAREAVRALRKKLPRSQRRGVAAADGRIRIELSTSQDLSKSGIKGIEEVLRTAVHEALKKNTKVVPSSSPVPGEGYAAQLTIQSVSERKDGGDSVVEVNCAATLLELPGRQLRFSTRIGASVSRSGKLTASERQELANEGVRSSGAALAEDMARWVINSRKK